MSFKDYINEKKVDLNPIQIKLKNEKPVKVDISGGTLKVKFKDGFSFEAKVIK